MTGEVEFESNEACERRRRLAELLWLNRARRARSAIARRYAELLGCAPQEIAFLDQAETGRLSSCFSDEERRTAERAVSSRAELVAAAQKALAGHDLSTQVWLGYNTARDIREPSDTYLVGAIIVPLRLVVNNLARLIEREQSEDLGVIALDGKFFLSTFCDWELKERYFAYLCRDPSSQPNALASGGSS